MMVLAAPFVRHQIVDEIYKECQKDDSDGYIPEIHKVCHRTWIIKKLLVLICIYKSTIGSRERIDEY